jgi:hypothetical protein
MSGVVLLLVPHGSVHMAITIARTSAARILIDGDYPEYRDINGDE